MFLICGDKSRFCEASTLDNSTTVKIFQIPLGCRKIIQSPGIEPDLSYISQLICKSAIVKEEFLRMPQTHQLISSYFLNRTEFGTLSESLQIHFEVK